MTAPTGRRIILTTFGSYGDLHPYIALALGLRERGHRVALAAQDVYQAKVEALGVEFHALRPASPPPEQIAEIIDKVMDQRTGPRFVVRDLCMPALRETYEDLLTFAHDADLLVGHPLTFATRLVAEKRGIPWASSVLAPLSFFSAHEPPVFPQAQLLRKLRFLGPRFHRPLFGLMKWTCRSWTTSWHALRAELGLPRVPDALFAGQHSPELVLALYSPVLGQPQPDWPANVHVTGYLFYDHDGDAGLTPELERFLASGPAPIVFTLGTSAVVNPGAFFEESIRAARLLGRRAVLLVGRDERTWPKGPLPEGMITCPYAPFSQLFPRAAAVVHQCGAGTMGQALRAGRPMLCVPFAHDQPDHADRACRLGVARSVHRYKYRTDEVARELRALLEDETYAGRAAEVALQVSKEDGREAACSAIESQLSADSRRHLQSHQPVSKSPGSSCNP